MDATKPALENVVTKFTTAFGGTITVTISGLDRPLRPNMVTIHDETGGEVTFMAQELDNLRYILMEAEEIASGNV